MKAKFCLPIIKTSAKEIIEIVSRNKNVYDMFEVWIDYVQESFPVILDLIESLSKDLQNRLIVVFRRLDSKQIHMNFEERKNILLAIAKTKAYVDLDMQSQQQDLDFMKKNRGDTQIIASFHDYKTTQRTSSLTRLVEQMETFNPTIYKIATYCQTEKKALALLHLLLDLKEQQKKVIILGMGEKGVATRIFGSLWGNEIIFAPEEMSEQSAPGQLTKEQLTKIFSIISM